METQIDSPFTIQPAKGEIQPIIISIPHVGTLFPNEVKDAYLPNQVSSLDDTDWFLDQLYAFAPEMGITIVKANYSRWLIDLNRDPESKPLYNDGRIITGLTSLTDFLGEPIYKEGREPDQQEIQRRLAAYFWPYYKKIQDEIELRRATFKNVVLWDAHSIRQSVPTIRAEHFPEMILGTADETSAHHELIKSALNSLRAVYQVNHNDPFKGGHITRYFGRPVKGVHALQLERNKILYMDDNERIYNAPRAEQMQNVLKKTFVSLLETLKMINK